MFQFKMNNLKSLGIFTAVCLMIISSMDMLYLISNKEFKELNDLVKEIIKPVLVALMAFIFVINALFVKKNLLFIFPTTFFSLISIRYFLGIFYLAITTDRVISTIINTTRLQSINSIFSLPVLPSNVEDAREQILSFCLVMSLTMFSMAVSSYKLMMEEKTVRKQSHQVGNSTV